MAVNSSKLTSVHLYLLPFAVNSDAPASSATLEKRVSSACQDFRCHVIVRLPRGAV